MKDKVLVVVAHPDDEALGCGGTIARLTDEGIEVRVVSLADGEGAREIDSNRDHQLSMSCDVLGVKSFCSYNLKDNRLDDYNLLDLIKIIEKEVSDFCPTIVFTHSLSDLNIDHQLAHKATITACRSLPSCSVRKIFAFEVPSSTEWSSFEGAKFSPNYYVNIEKFLDKKIAALMCYTDEVRLFPHPRSCEYVESLSKVRGAEAGVKNAEAFTLLRQIVK